MEKYFGEKQQRFIWKLSVDSSVCNDFKFIFCVCIR